MASFGLVASPTPSVVTMARSLRAGSWINGPIGTALNWDFSRPGKPTDNAYIEACNARLRAECLHASWFLSLHDARDRIESWRHDYNTARPPSALGNLTPRGLLPRQAHEARKIA